MRGRRSSPASPAARPSRCACRPGCEERCSYCIIPTTRGSSRSLPVDDVVREVVRVAASGFKEIALTGVHLGSYGRDLRPEGSLTALLRALCDVPHDVTFRVSSLEPMDCTPAIVDLVASSGGRFAPHFHLPLQHASDRMLRQMRRPYTLDDYRRLVDGIVGRLPHASIGTDLIAGFPGRERRRLRRERGVSTVLAAVASARLPLLGPSGHRGHRTARQGGGTGDSRARRAAASDRRDAVGALSRGTGRHDPARADARGRLARRHRQLSESRGFRRECHATSACGCG